MMIVRPSTERGHADHGWLKSKHSFSFADYHDREHMGLSSLRVLNEDWVAPGAGFSTHPHRDMEILTYVIEGAVEHKDSLGNAAVIRPGEVQRMTAGTGVRHSEYNASQAEPLHLLQIWLRPRERGLAPGYEQRQVGADLRNNLQLVASGRSKAGVVNIHQDADVFASRLEKANILEHSLAAGRVGWLQLIEGQLTLGSNELNTGDGVALTEPQRLEIRADLDSHFLLFDLAAISQQHN